ncbi:MAG: polysaccharide biosynthesis protein [Clostridia bacterium]|nr:polysaccharide biosynthesis protein [Clostridia bacterium]
MNRIINRLKYFILDFILADIAVITTAAFTFNLDILFSNRIIPFIFLIGFPNFLIAMLYLLRVYYILWEFTDMFSYIRILFSSFASASVLYLVSLAINEIAFDFYPYEALLLALLTFSLISVFRAHVAKRRKKLKAKKDGIVGNIMIIGAGSAGNLIINDIRNSSEKKKYSIKCLIDDDPLKKSSIINGIEVIGGSNEIVSAAKQYRIDTIIFAIPTCPSSKKSAILNICQKTGCKVRVLPSYYQLLNDDNVNAATLRDVQIEDLLGRDPIDIKVESVLQYVSDNVVLVTGGGGSIGSELCRQISCHNPKKLIIFDIYENNAYDIQNELLRDHPELDLEVLIGSVRDINRLDAIFEKYKPQLVFHAAAHKHVPLMEDSPNESIKNNVFGTYNVADCADRFGVKRFVLISTDKAVNPTNIMGASKRICEMVVQYFNSRSKTEFVAVRFGNVLGSNGSVIPLFKKQIEEGGPVTVTDANIIRYFMTIPEAVSLVLQAGATAKGGEIFVLDMGEPVKIIDLAENLIRLSGLEPYTDIKIEFIGLRPGEKMYEEKLLAEEGLMRTENRLIHIGRPIMFDEKEFLSILTQLKDNMANDNADIRAIVRTLVPTYSYNE